MIHGFVINADYFDLVTVVGADAERFLQGQLTCDVASLQVDCVGFGACCNNKGRVIATFNIIRREDGYSLCMNKGLGEILLKALRKYLPFYKCSMEIHQPNTLMMFVGECGMKLLEIFKSPTLKGGELFANGLNWLCRLPGAPLQLVANIPSPTEDITALLEAVALEPLQSWEALRLTKGHFPFHPTDTERFTPQELNLDQNGYVSFAKGCYTGQEIVARMHYRGKLKKKLYLLQLDQPLNAVEATSVRDAHGAELGRCLLTRQFRHCVFVLAELTSPNRIESHPHLVGTSLVVRTEEFVETVNWEAIWAQSLC